MDITKIDGYSEGMTPEQILELVKGYEIPAPDLSGYVEKSTFDKTASDLAKVKKDFNARLSDEEKRNAEIEAIKAENAQYKRNDAIGKRSLEFASGLGCDAETARKLAESFIDGGEDFSALMNTLVAAKVSAEVSAKLGGQSVPQMNNGQSDNKINKEKLKTMSREEISKIPLDELQTILKE